MAGSPMLGLNLKILNCACLWILTPNIDSLNIVPIVNNFIKMAGTPPHIIFVLNSLRKKRCQIGERYQSAVSMQIVQKSELAPWISQRSQIFDKGNLHLRTRKQHSRMPCKLGLPFDESHFRRLGFQRRVAAFEFVVECNSDGQRSWSESNANEIVYFIVPVSLQQ
jgi:hypothetical protein